MYAHLGTRQAYSQAYHHQANGRAEVAGQQLTEILRKIHVEGKISWLDALPQVIDRIHDVKGRGGISPYQVIFGRERPLGNVPYNPERECEDAIQFFEGRKRVDREIAKLLNDIHKHKADQLNEERRVFSTFKVGDKVWYRRPPNTGHKLDSRWVGPCVVVEREGAQSYVIRVKEGSTMKAHRGALKPYRDDAFSGKKVELFYHQRTPLDEGVGTDEWEVDKILKHRRDPKGKYSFLTRWKGQEENEETWEPVVSFIPRINTELVKYVEEKGLPKGIFTDLPTESNVQ